jgi:replicative DNA helicase
VKVPYDPDAELAVLGALAVWPAVTVPEVLPVLGASEFYLPAHQRLFLAVKTIHERGEAIEPTALIDELRKLGDDKPGELLASAQSHSERRVAAPVRVVAQMALRRRLLSEAAELRKGASDLAADPADVLDTARTSLASVQSVLSSTVSDDEGFDDFLTRTDANPSPWLIPGLIAEQWRVVIVATPGEGKTWLMRQLAVCAAYGIRPFGPYERTAPKVRVLIVDLENTTDHVHSNLSALVKEARHEAGPAETDPRLWRRMGGIDLRSRADRSELEKVLVNRRPQLLVLGPLKNAYRVKGSDAWDLIAREVQGVLNDWRERFTLTMLIEDHAPHGNVLRPFGSSLWESWPEIGIAIEPEHKGRRNLTRWRGDRMPTNWPDALVRSKPWPWAGVWDAGVPEEQEEF